MTREDKIDYCIERSDFFGGVYDHDFNTLNDDELDSCVEYLSELYADTEEDSDTFENFISKGDFILTKDGGSNYLWDDWEKCNELVKENKSLYIYTVVDEDNKLWVIEGKLRFNRMGYLFSRKYVKINGNIEY